MERNRFFSLALVAALLPTTSAPAQVHTPLAGGPRGGGPANDEACDVAVDTLAIGASVYWSGSLVGATDSEGFGMPTVWQAFTITECAAVTLEFCGSQIASPWLSYYVWTQLIGGTCDSLGQSHPYHMPYSTCADDNGVFTFNGLAPGTYYVRIFSQASLAYTIHASATVCMPPPPNDEVCDAVPDILAVGGSITWNGAMAGATDTESLGMNTVWEAFTLSECADVTFNWCGSSSNTLPEQFMLVTGDCNDPADWNSFDTAFQISDCPGGVLLNTEYAYGLEAGTYYLLISAGFPETYVLEVSAVTCAPPPANDHCDAVETQALTIGSSLTFTGQVTSSTADGDYHYSFPGNQSIPIVWHAFTTTECTHITISYCAMEPPYSYTSTEYWAFISPNCPMDGTRIYAYVDWEGCSHEYWDLLAGTYYLPVFHMGGAAWPYTIEVQAAACGQYCAASAFSAGGAKISHVSFAGIDRASTSYSGYENFLGDTAYVQPGGSYPITVAMVQGHITDQVLAWIDDDGSNTFEADELVLSTPLGGGPFSGTVTIPANAALGTTRLRLRLQDADVLDDANNTPCGLADYGQVEDYTVLIEDGMGIGENRQDAEPLHAWPNPVTAVLHLRGPGPGELRILGVDGTEVARTRVAAEATVDLAHLAAGVYTMVLDDGTAVHTQLIVKQ